MHALIIATIFLSFSGMTKNVAQIGFSLRVRTSLGIGLTCYLKFQTRMMNSLDGERHLVDLVALQRCRSCNLELIKGSADTSRHLDN